MVEIKWNGELAGVGCKRYTWPRNVPAGARGPEHILPRCPHPFLTRPASCFQPSFARGGGGEEPVPLSHPRATSGCTRRATSFTGSPSNSIDFRFRSFFPYPLTLATCSTFLFLSSSSAKNERVVSRLHVHSDRHVHISWSIYAYVYVQSYRFVYDHTYTIGSCPGVVQVLTRWASSKSLEKYSKFGRVVCSIGGIFYLLIDRSISDCGDLFFLKNW